MTLNGWLQFFVYFALLVVCMRPVGLYMARLFNGEIRFLRPVENAPYRVSGIDPSKEMDWREYTIVMLLFSFVSLLLTYVIERTQQWLPWNKQHFGAVAPDLAWNTAASFTTNTNWQAYTPETTMSYFTQMVGLAYHNFFSAAVGIAVAIALVRGIARRETRLIGNFWVDTTRACLYLLLPICTVFALVLVSQGVIQNLHPYTLAQTLEHSTQTIAQGPVASQEAIKMLGTNGGGFFNANSSHPFENPTPLSNFLQMISIFLIGGGLTVTLGRMTGSRGHGWAVFACMAILFAAGFVCAYYCESQANRFRAKPERTWLVVDGARPPLPVGRVGLSASAPDAGSPVSFQASGSGDWFYCATAEGNFTQRYGGNGGAGDGGAGEGWGNGVFRGVISRPMPNLCSMSAFALDASIDSRLRFRFRGVILRLFANFFETSRPRHQIILLR